jgi:hypothetical protein
MGHQWADFGHCGAGNLSGSKPCVAQEYTGQRWEYQVESFAFTVASPMPGVMSGISVPAGTPPPDMAMVITRRLNEFGAQGWELVSSDLLPGEGSPAFVWKFKRPAE